MTSAFSPILEVIPWSFFSRLDRDLIYKKKKEREKRGREKEERKTCLPNHQYKSVWTCLNFIHFTVVEPRSLSDIELFIVSFDLKSLSELTRLIDWNWFWYRFLIFSLSLFFYHFMQYTRNNFCQDIQQQNRYFKNIL